MQSNYILVDYIQTNMHGGWIGLSFCGLNLIPTQEDRHGLIGSRLTLQGTGLDKTCL